MKTSQDQIHMAKIQKPKSAKRKGRKPTRSGWNQFSVRVVTTRTKNPSLCLSGSEHVSYLVNSHFDVEWVNTEAAPQASPTTALSSDQIIGGSVFTALFQDAALEQMAGFDDLLRIHLAIAKQRLSKSALLARNAHLSPEQLMRLGSLYDQVGAVSTRELVSTEANLAAAGDSECWYSIYAASFREGIVFSYARALDTADALAALLSRRDMVIRDILKHRRPYKTRLAVLVADLAGSTRLSAELPAEEYFELVNQIWGSMSKHIRNFQATHGKHVGDGMVAYFLPQADSNYAFNTLKCAQAMSNTMTDISAEWKARKGWVHDLKLNIGIDEGEEWFGTYQTPTHLEFTVLGDTINRGARLSDFARNGSIWTSKAAISCLAAQERDSIKYGVRHTCDGVENLVLNTYSRISDLVDFFAPANAKLADIANLAVTEILEVVAPSTLQASQFHHPSRSIFQSRPQCEFSSLKTIRG